MVLAVTLLPYSLRILAPQAGMGAGVAAIWARARGLCRLGWNPVTRDWAWPRSRVMLYEAQRNMAEPGLRVRRAASGVHPRLPPSPVSTCKDPAFQPTAMIATAPRSIPKKDPQLGLHNDGVGPGPGTDKKNTKPPLLGGAAGGHARARAKKNAPWEGAKLPRGAGRALARRAQEEARARCRRQKLCVAGQRRLGVWVPARRVVRALGGVVRAARAGAAAARVCAGVARAMGVCGGVRGAGHASQKNDIRWS